VQDVLTVSLAEEGEKKSPTEAENCSVSNGSFACHLSGEIPNLTSE
jgi:hypothetical protein